MKTISQKQVAAMLIAADESPRKRSHIIVHESHDEPVQRILIGLKRGTYVRPHRHADIGEFGLVISGHCTLLCFDEDGKIAARHELGPDQETAAYDLKPNEWHSLIAQSEDSVFFEAKAGPFNPETAAEFAEWAPAEGDKEVGDYLTWMESVSPA